jgi:hypothetical protein
METSWNEAEERLTAETMASGLSRIAAIQRLRRKWLVGETAPPGWKAGRPMPEENPRFQTIKDLAQDRSDTLAKPSLLGAEASTRSGKRLTALRLRKAASLRQARWRAKKKEAAALSFAQAA